MIDWIPPQVAHTLHRCAVRGCRSRRGTRIGPPYPDPVHLGVLSRYCGVHRKSYQAAVRRQGGAVVIPFRRKEPTWLA